MSDGPCLPPSTPLGAPDQLSHDAMRGACEEAPDPNLNPNPSPNPKPSQALSLLRGKEHLAAVGKGAPSPLAAPARAALAGEP